MKFQNLWFFSFKITVNTTTKIYSLKYSGTTSWLLSLFTVCLLILFHMRFNFVINDKISNKCYILMCTGYYRAALIFIWGAMMRYLVEGGSYLMHEAYKRKYGISALKCDFFTKTLKTGEKHHSWKAVPFCYIIVFWRRIKLITKIFR